MEEVWKDIPHYEDLYQVSSLGRVRCKTTRRLCSNQFIKNNMEHKGDILPQWDNGRGYQLVRLCGVRGTDLKSKREYVHRLVALAFIPNPENKPQVDHINCCRSDNEVTNLKWVTQSENNLNPITNKKMRDSFTNERREFLSNRMKGENNPANTHPEKNYFIVNNPRTGGYHTKGRHWYNNGVINKMCYECPEGFIEGKI